MDENNVHTSVFIELANQEEPEGQKTYRIDIDDVEPPKDYVIDQIFCGENVTVYALFEVLEGTKFSDKSLKNMPNPNLQDNYKFFHKSSYKEIINEKNMNRFKRNSSVIHSNDDVKFLSERSRGNKSLYCLKHLSSDYGMLTPEKKNSELKFLYSKETVSQSTKCTTPKGLRFKSKGVNTDIVQSPKIVEDVQRAMGVNILIVKNKEKNVEDSYSSFSKSSYEVIEMDMQQSYSSVNSDSDKKAVSNYFIVPLLLMEDGIVSHREKIDKNQKLEEEKLQCSEKIITRKVSLGTNTDIIFESYKKTEQNSNDASQSESYKTDSENYEDQNLYVKKENSNEKLIINSKETIIKEIKIMQRKLNILIKSIESNDFVFNAKENESNTKTINDRTKNLERMSEPLLNEMCQKKYQKLDERPIFLPFRYPLYPNKEKSKSKKRSQSISISEKTGTSTAAKKSFSNGILANSASFESVAVRNDQTAKDNVKKLTSNSQMNCLDLENRKTFSAKSESCIRVIISAPKHNSNNGLKKSQSFDLKCDKIEALKKTKNLSYKVESSIKTKANIWIHQNKEGPLRNNLSLMKCEMGDDVNKKPINNIIEGLNVIQITEKTENSEKSENSGLEEIVVDVKKNFCKEEGDAKLVCPKETLVTANIEEVQVHYHYASVTPSENLLKPKKSPCTMAPKTLDKTAEIGAKISSVVEKPVTPNKSNRKINTTDSNAKKDVKINKKINSKVKVVEKVNKPEVKEVPQSEIEKKKALTGSRKSARHNAESKLHIDKLIKLDSLGSHFKATLLAKSNHDEKSGTKTERAPRPISQKQERSEHPVDVFFDENIKEENEIPKKKSSTLVQVESFYKNDVGEREEPRCPKIKEEMLEEVNSNLMSENFLSLSTKPSSVIVELFSKKPNSANEFHYKADQENLEKSFTVENATFDKNGAEKETNENSENMEKLIVKSVWALTKVLLYEDGTNKLEVLEASLTPPDYSLNEPLKRENKII